MICAVINSDGQVVNTIVADTSATPPAGCVLVSVPDGWPVSIGWTWTADGGFRTAEGEPYTPPEPEPEGEGE